MLTKFSVDKRRARPYNIGNFIPMESDWEKKSSPFLARTESPRELQSGSGGEDEHGLGVAQPKAHRSGCDGAARYSGGV